MKIDTMFNQAGLSPAFKSSSVKLKKSKQPVTRNNKYTSKKGKKTVGKLGIEPAEELRVTFGKTAAGKPGQATLTQSIPIPPSVPVMPNSA